MEFEKFTCPIHNIVVEQPTGCEQCLDEFDNRREANDMTPNERVAEFNQLMGVLTMPFENVHQRLEELVGRSVWTHEFGLNIDGLREECRLSERDRQPDMETVIGSLEEAGKPVIIVKAD